MLELSEVYHAIRFLAKTTPTDPWVQTHTYTYTENQKVDTIFHGKLYHVNKLLIRTNFSTIFVEQNQTKSDF